MFRLALPVLSCAALLWFGSDSTPTPRAAPLATPDVTEVQEAPVRPQADPEAPPPSDAPEPPPEPELRQHDVRDLVARGYAVDRLARMVGREATAAHVTAIVNVLEVVAPAGKQLEIEQLLDERRRSPNRPVLQFYDVKDICADDPPEIGPPFDIESVIQAIEATIGIGAAEIQPKNRVLVVRAGPAVHAAIAAFLGDLRANVEAPPPGAQ